MLLGISLTLHLVLKLQLPKPIAFIISSLGITISIAWGTMIQNSYDRNRNEYFKKKELEYFNEIIRGFMDSKTYSSSSTTDEKLSQYLNDNNILYSEEDYASLLEILIHRE